MTDTPRDGRRWATRAEAAEYARVSDDTLDAWGSDRDVPVTRYSAGKRRVLIDLDEIDAYITANATGRVA